MTIPPLLLQTAGTLVAVLALAGLVRWLKLGGAAPALTTLNDVALIAAEIEDGFAPIAAACDPAGAGALARDAAGRIMLIRPHGNRYAGRVLTPKAAALRSSLPGSANIAIDCGEAWFGKTFLTIDEPDAWAMAINGLRTAP